jgi:phosphatidate cytidylyltransferase
MGALLVVFIPSFASSNVYRGLYWLLFPHICVVTNDVFSYSFGQLFGRTPLITISPNKTWEGFIGGLICTFIMAFIVNY